MPDARTGAEKIVHKARIYPVEPASYRTICLGTAKKRPLSVAARNMYEHIVNFCAANDLMNL